MNIPQPWVSSAIVALDLASTTSCSLHLAFRRRALSRSDSQLYLSLKSSENQMFLEAISNNYHNRTRIIERKINSASHRMGELLCRLQECPNENPEMHRLGQISLGNLAVVKDLNKELKVPADDKDDNGFSLLHHIAEKNIRPETVSYLFDNELVSNINSFTTDSKEMLLMLVCFNGYATHGRTPLICQIMAFHKCDEEYDRIQYLKYMTYLLNSGEDSSKTENKKAATIALYITLLLGYVVVSG